MTHSTVVAPLDRHDVHVPQLVQVLLPRDAYLAYEDAVSVVGRQAFFLSASFSSGVIAAWSSVSFSATAWGMLYHSARRFSTVR